MDKATKISKDTVRQIEQARKNLLDLTTRNSLLNFSVERYSNQIRIVNGTINTIYGNLIAGRGIELLPLPELPTEPKDEKTQRFRDALEIALIKDEEYAEAKKKLNEKDEVSEEDEEKILRELKNRVREQLGLPPFRGMEISKKQWAEENGINPSYENELDGISEMQKGQKYSAQTMLYPKEFKNKIIKLKRIIKSDNEEKGTKTFYIAFGFLEWYEQENSDKKHFAPLLLLKLEDLKNKGKGTGTEKIAISSAGEAIVTNLSLREKLKEFNLSLPEYQEDDSPVTYIQKVKKLVSINSKWRVRNYITVGRFIFSRLAMYEDLKIDNWKALLENGSALLKALFEGRISEGNTESIYDIDKDKDVERYAPILITSADSSQHSAIVDVMKGDDVVIKGPPGTGKSQTITNLIANALYNGKKVLFMAEKKAALDVVFSRLKHAGLEDYCFELHSDKTSITSIKDGLEKSRDKHFAAKGLGKKSVDTTEIYQQIDEKNKIRDYYDFLQSKVGQSGKTLFDLVWSTKKQEQYISKYPASFKNVSLGNVSKLKSKDWETDKEELGRLEKLYKAYQSSIQNLDESWKKISSCSIKMKDIHEYLEQIDVVRENINDCIDRKDEYINKSLAVDDTINGSNALLAELKDCSDYIKQNGIEVQWVQVLTNNEYCKKIAGFTKILRQYKEYEENLSDIYASPTSAMDKKDAYSTIYKSLKSSSLEDKTLKQLLDASDVIKKELIGWKSNSNLVDIANLIYRKGDSTINETCCVKELAEDFSQICRILPLYIQNSNMFKPYNWGVLDKVEAGIKELKEYKDSLSRVFDMETVLSFSDIEDQLSRIIKNINNAGLFSFLSNDYRTSIKFYKMLAKTTKIVSEEAVANCKRLWSYIREYKEFESNKIYKEVLGEYFQGIKTEIKDIQKVRKFYENINNLEALYGEQATKPIYQFFANNDNFDLFQKIANLASSCTDFEVAFPEIIENQPLKDYVKHLLSINELTGTLSEDFLSLFSNQNITIAQIANSYDNILQLQELKDKLSDDNNTIQQIIPSLAKGTDSDGNKLDSLLEFKQKVKQCKHIKETDVFLMRVSQDLLPETIANTKKYYEQLNDLNNQIKSISVLFEIGGERFNNDKYKTSQLDDLLNYFNSLSDNRDAIYNMCAFYDNLGAIKGKRYEEVVRYLRDNRHDLDNLVSIYDYLVCYNLVKNIKDISWEAYIPDEMGQVVEKIRDLEEDIYKLNVKLLKQKLDGVAVPGGINSTRVNEKTQLQLINHICEISKPRISLRRFIKQAGEAVLALKPCFLMSPIAVAQYIPPYSTEFDLLIIDEASQMYFEEALGGIFRAKQIVVVGDEKQLPPSNFFKNTSKDDAFDEDEEEYEDDNGKSVLDICVERGFTRKELLWHYRSKDSSLITFSNVNFYNEKLKIFPSPTIYSENIGVHYNYVGGVYGNSQNEEEADAIIREVKKFVREHPDRSLGIATINDKQKQLVEAKYDQLRESDKVFQKYCDKWANGIESFFVKNLENVQGDERDYIFVSTVYGPDEKSGKVMQRFGPINHKNGHRRLNVLFTRAKYGLKLFTSMKSDDIVITGGSSLGVNILKKYLLYAETGKIDYAQVSGKDFDSEFEKMVYDILVSKGYEVDKQVGVKGFFIDLAVKHPLNKSYYAVGIECDGAPYHSTKSARDRDCIRQSVLESLGWKIYRIWSKDWYYSTQKEIEKLLACIEDVSKTAPTIEYEANNNYENIYEERDDDTPEVDDKVNEDSASLTPDDDDDVVSYDIIPAKIYHVDDTKNRDLFTLEKAPLQDKSVKRKRVEVYDTVTYIRTSDDTEHTVQITPNVSDLEKGLINKNTPLAVELLDGEENDEVEVNGKIILIKKITKGAGIKQK